MNHQLNVRAFFLSTFICLAGASVGRADVAKPTILRVGLERGISHVFAKPVSEFISLDSLKIIETKHLNDSTLLFIGRRIGTASVLVKLKDETDYQTLLVRVLPYVDEEETPDLSVRVGRYITVTANEEITAVNIDAPTVVRALAQSAMAINLSALQPGLAKVSVTTKSGTKTYLVECYLDTPTDGPTDSERE